MTTITKRAALLFSGTRPLRVAVVRYMALAD